jgi:5-methylcytosine-specific restriction endonuclease McrA
VVTGGGADVAAEVVIHVRGDDPTSTLADGTPLTEHAVASLLPEAFVSLLVKDMDARPIDASPRRRSPTRRQRRVLDETHPTCGHPGCSARAFLQYDHLHPYSEGGPTTLTNLWRLCGPHNRARQDSAVRGP